MMLHQFLNHLISWEEFYGNTIPEIHKGKHVTKNDQKIIFTSSEQAYVVDCYFEKLTTSGKSGAIYASIKKFLVESCAFLDISTSSTSTSTAGAIYYSNIDGGSSVINKVCSYLSYSRGNGLFAQTIVKSETPNPNLFIDSSIVHSETNYWACYGVLFNRYGRILYERDNISQNKCPTCSAFYCNPTKGEGKNSASYSSFSNNTATTFILMEIDFFQGSFSIEFCNIIRNTSPEYLIQIKGKMDIINSCILSNSLTENMFEILDSSAPTTVSRCTIDNIKSNFKITYEENTGTAFINPLVFTKTKSCDAVPDSVGTLTFEVEKPKTIGMGKLRMESLYMFILIIIVVNLY